MEANELMIGDFVDFYHPYEPEKKIITRHRITETFECGLVGISDHGNPVHADHIEPIKITLEILEKNGFKPLEEGSYVCKELSGIDDYRIVVDLLVPYLSYIEKNKMPKSRYSGEIKYVHQLQHALRLCGINKKIKLEE